MLWQATTALSLTAGALLPGNRSLEHVPLLILLCSYRGLILDTGRWLYCIHRALDLFLSLIVVRPPRLEKCIGQPQPGTCSQTWTCVVYTIAAFVFARVAIRMAFLHALVLARPLWRAKKGALLCEAFFVVHLSLSPTPLAITPNTWNLHPPPLSSPPV